MIIPEKNYSSLCTSNSDVRSTSQLSQLITLFKPDNKTNYIEQLLVEELPRLIAQMSSEKIIETIVGTSSAKIAAENLQGASKKRTASKGAPARKSKKDDKIVSRPVEQEVNGGSTTGVLGKKKDNVKLKSGAVPAGSSSAQPPPSLSAILPRLQAQQKKEEKKILTAGTSAGAAGAVVPGAATGGEQEDKKVVDGHGTTAAGRTTTAVEVDLINGKNMKNDKENKSDTTATANVFKTNSTTVEHQDREDSSSHKSLVSPAEQREQEKLRFLQLLPRFSSVQSRTKRRGPAEIGWRHYQWVFLHNITEKGLRKEIIWTAKFHKTDHRNPRSAGDRWKFQKLFKYCTDAQMKREVEKMYAKESSQFLDRFPLPDANNFMKIFEANKTADKARKATLEKDHWDVERDERSLKKYLAQKSLFRSHSGKEALADLHDVLGHYRAQAVDESKPRVLRAQLEQVDHATALFQPTKSDIYPHLTDAIQSKDWKSALIFTFDLFLGGMLQTTCAGTSKSSSSFSRTSSSSLQSSFDRLLENCVFIQFSAKKYVEQQEKLLLRGPVVARNAMAAPILPSKKPPAPLETVSKARSISTAGAQGSSSEDASSLHIAKRRKVDEEPHQGGQQPAGQQFMSSTTSSSTMSSSFWPTTTFPPPSVLPTTTFQQHTLPSLAPTCTFLKASTKSRTWQKLCFALRKMFAFEKVNKSKEAEEMADHNMQAPDVKSAVEQVLVKKLESVKFLKNNENTSGLSGSSSGAGPRKQNSIADQLLVPAAVGGPQTSQQLRSSRLLPPLLRNVDVRDFATVLEFAKHFDDIRKRKEAGNFLDETNPLEVARMFLDRLPTFQANLITDFIYMHFMINPEVDGRPPTKCNLILPGAVSMVEYVVLNHPLWRVGMCQHWQCGMSHRYDMGTGGPLLWQKTFAGREINSLNIESARMSKDYVCLVHGSFSEACARGCITFPLDQLAGRALRVTKGENGKKVCQLLDEIKQLPGVSKDRTAYPFYCFQNMQETAAVRTKEDYICLKFWMKKRGDSSMGEYNSVTHYEVIQQFEYKNRYYSLVHCRILTGRTHQIRAHMRAIGHPLVHDRCYALRGEQERRGPLAATNGIRKAEFEMMDVNPTGEIHLYKYRNSFLSGTSRFQSIESEPPQNFRVLLSKLNPLTRFDYRRIEHYVENHSENLPLLGRDPENMQHPDRRYFLSLDRRRRRRCGYSSKYFGLPEVLPPDVEINVPLQDEQQQQGNKFLSAGAPKIKKQSLMKSTMGVLAEASTGAPPTSTGMIGSEVATKVAEQDEKNVTGVVEFSCKNEKAMQLNQGKSNPLCLLPAHEVLGKEEDHPILQVQDPRGGPNEPAKRRRVEGQTNKGRTTDEAASPPASTLKVPVLPPPAPARKRKEAHLQRDNRQGIKQEAESTNLLAPPHDVVLKEAPCSTKENRGEKELVLRAERRPRPVVQENKTTGVEVDKMKYPQSDDEEDLRSSRAASVSSSRRSSPRRPLVHRNGSKNYSPREEQDAGSEGGAKKDEERVSSTGKKMVAGITQDRDDHDPVLKQTKKFRLPVIGLLDTDVGQVQHDKQDVRNKRSKERPVFVNKSTKSPERGRDVENLHTTTTMSKLSPAAVAVSLSEKQEEEVQVVHQDVELRPATRTSSLVEQNKMKDADGAQTPGSGDYRSERVGSELSRGGFRPDEEQMGDRDDNRGRSKVRTNSKVRGHHSKERAAFPTYKDHSREKMRREESRKRVVVQDEVKEVRRQPSKVRDDREKPRQHDGNVDKQDLPVVPREPRPELKRDGNKKRESNMNSGNDLRAPGRRSASLSRGSQKRSKSRSIPRPRSSPSIPRKRSRSRSIPRPRSPSIPRPGGFRATGREPSKVRAPSQARQGVHLGGEENTKRALQNVKTPTKSCSPPRLRLRLDNRKSSSHHGGHDQRETNKYNTATDVVDRSRGSSRDRRSFGHSDRNKDHSFRGKPKRKDSRSRSPGEDLPPAIGTRKNRFSTGRNKDRKRSSSRSRRSGGEQKKTSTSGRHNARRSGDGDRRHLDGPLVGMMRKCGANEDYNNFRRGNSLARGTAANSVPLARGTAANSVPLGTRPGGRGTDLMGRSVNNSEQYQIAHGAGGVVPLSQENHVNTTRLPVPPRGGQHVAKYHPSRISDLWTLKDHPEEHKQLFAFDFANYQCWKVEKETELGLEPGYLFGFDVKEFEALEKKHGGARKVVDMCATEGLINVRLMGKLALEEEQEQKEQKEQQQQQQAGVPRPNIPVNNNPEDLLPPSRRMARSQMRKGGKNDKGSGRRRGSSFYSQSRNGGGPYYHSGKLQTKGVASFAAAAAPQFKAAPVPGPPSKLPGPLSKGANKSGSAEGCTTGNTFTTGTSSSSKGASNISGGSCTTKNTKNATMMNMKGRGTSTTAGPLSTKGVLTTAGVVAPSSSRAAGSAAVSATNPRAGGVVAAGVVSTNLNTTTGAMSKAKSVMLASSSATGGTAANGMGNLGNNNTVGTSTGAAPPAVSTTSAPPVPPKTSPPLCLPMQHTQSKAGAPAPPAVSKAFPPRGKSTAPAPLV
ncbi:unnamed protein product [Amoebophrya sp. A120]|nr:unnamed protein product [Amoebophrya sp. A120]|eukprot:GSA120T00023232001.1